MITKGADLSDEKQLDYRSVITIIDDTIKNMTNAVLFDSHSFISIDEMVVRLQIDDPVRWISWRESPPTVNEFVVQNPHNYGCEFEFKRERVEGDDGRVYLKVLKDSFLSRSWTTGHKPRPSVVLINPFDSNWVIPRSIEEHSDDEAYATEDAFLTFVLDSHIYDSNYLRRCVIKQYSNGQRVELTLQTKSMSANEGLLI